MSSRVDLMLLLIALNLLAELRSVILERRRVFRVRLREEGEIEETGRHWSDTDQGALKCPPLRLNRGLFSPPEWNCHSLPVATSPCPECASSPPLR